jgi:type IV pilus assembly protein PilB
MIKSSKKLGEILIEKGLISQPDLDEALAEQRNTGEFLGAILIKRLRIEEADLLTALSAQFGIPLINLSNKYIDWDLVKKFSASLISQHRCFPINQNNRQVSVAITNPLDVWALKKCEEESGGRQVEFFLVTNADMDDLLGRYAQQMRSQIIKKIE